MRFTTLIRARTPRADCPEHGVKKMQVPWAAPQGRFTLPFERFAVEGGQIESKMQKQLGRVARQTSTE